MAMNQKCVVIIGGGLGGLAVALRLAANNWQVTVCEQGDKFGGKMNRWEQNGFRFDTGPSLITMRWVFEDLFKATGNCIKDYVEFTQMHPLANYVYADGTKFSYSSSMPEWLETLRQIESKDVDGFLRFMRLGASLFEVSKETFLRQRPFDLPDVRSLKSLHFMPLRYGWGNYHETVAAHFKSPFLQQLYDRYPTYVGSSPYSSPATLAVIPYLEFAFGGWHIKGGLYRLVESLIEIANGLGIQLLTNARVEQIEHDKTDVKGVRLSDGTNLKADVVVMNGDVSTMSSLLRDDVKRKPREEKDHSLSGLVFLLGVKRNLPQISHHTVYFSSDYRREFSELFDERKFPTDPTVYVSAPSRTDRSVAPDAGETLFIMANAPANENGWNEVEIEKARERVFERLSKSGFPNIEPDIDVSDLWTPRRIANAYLMPGGAIYGVTSHGWRNAFLRPPNKDSKLKGLYYVGGSTHPGGGTPTVLLSAEIVCKLIERYETP
jgi:phytoene desaturase